MYVNDNMNEIFYYDNDISNDWTHLYITKRISL